MSPVRTPVEGAERLGSKGIKVFPLHSMKDGMCTCGDINCENKAKHPAITHWQDMATANLSTIRQLWGYAPYANIGIPPVIVTGKL